MKEIILNNGMKAKVDDSKFEELSKYNWLAIKASNGPYYAVRSVKDGGKWKMKRMHREAFGDCEGFLIDHKDMDTLNNQFDNLRKCNKAQNGRNRGKQRNNTSGYKGVFWNKNSKKWLAVIRVNRKVINLGSFECKIQAAKAYDRAALLHHGEFANINNI
jgi:hypothetical protein